VTADDEVPLLHAQGAAAALLDAMAGQGDVLVRPAGRPTAVSEVAALLRGFDEVYRRGEIPALPDRFTIDLFNTYRSYLFPDRFPHHPQLHSDARGDLMETSRAHGGTSQGFVSTTRPGMTRGDHYHLHKIARFFVVRGTAEISLRRLLHDEVVTFRLDGTRPGFVDMPTLWVHNITNVGDDDLVTVFWADQLLDPVNPDQYPERVHLEVS
jgi:UDP-2-acetamido-2,6-beta-L-arabino-hexul-4-ose reductase